VLEEKLVIDWRKVAFWSALAGALLSFVLLASCPYYQRWCALEDARTQVQVEQILKGGRK
jgi:hypothetical protein